MHTRLAKRQTESKRPPRIKRGREMFTRGDVEMFVSSSVASLTPKQEAVPEVRDEAWFKATLLELGFCSLQVAWGYQDWFRAVPTHLMDSYMHHLPGYYRQGVSIAHAKALECAQGDYEARLLHSWNVFD
jgi:hypothetical protein